MPHFQIIGHCGPTARRRFTRFGHLPERAPAPVRRPLPEGDRGMMACCGEHLFIRTKIAFTFLEHLARARALEFGAVLLHQAVRVDAVLPWWIFG